MYQRPALRSVATLMALAGVFTLAACDSVAPVAEPGNLLLTPALAKQSINCTASVKDGSVRCGALQSDPNGPRADIIGGQNIYVRLTSSNVSSVGGIFQFDVTVQNLLNEAMGSINGSVVDAGGIKVFFHTQPVVTGGTGTVTVANADGTGTFTASNQPYFQYSQKLAKDEVSASKTWQLAYDPGVQTFTFQVYVNTVVQKLLIINEVLVNPGGTISDASGEWFEIYNAGSLPVNLQGLTIRDKNTNGPGGTRVFQPRHTIASSLVIQPGGYAVLGNTTNTTNNGGVPVDYAYGSALAFANTIDHLRIEYPIAAEPASCASTDSCGLASEVLVLDETQYANAAISAQNGISRELRNPALDNSNMDGGNWGDALNTAVYGPGGRGTPKAQNSVYTP